MPTRSDAPGPTLEIAVVVSTYRRAGLLPRLVAALEAQTLEPYRFEVVLVDNGSGDDTREVLERLAGASPLRLRVLAIEVNRGPAAARNLGWTSTSAPFVAFTDDDCVPRADWLVQALRTCRACPELGVLQGATLRPPGSYVYGPNTSYRETLRPSPYFEGCNLVFPRSVLERTGGFDESFTFGGEDTAAGWSALEDGSRWIFDESCVVTHDIVERPWRWHLMMAWREGALVDVAARYPDLRRRGFWRSWAHRPWNVAFVVGFLATVAAVWWPILLLGWLPWAWLRRPPTRNPFRALPLLARWFVNDAVAEAGMVWASIRNRVVVL